MVYDNTVDEIQVKEKGQAVEGVHEWSSGEAVLQPRGEASSDCISCVGLVRAA